MGRNNTFEVIGGKRLCGKTTRLIKKSFETQYPILCPHKDMAVVVYEQARGMGLDIPHPITTEDLKHRSRKGGKFERVIIEEVQSLLRELLNVEVVAMSTSYKLNELDSLLENPKDSGSPLLQIELERFGEAPKVFLNGNEIEKKEDVKFTWSTRDAVEASVTELAVSHFDNEGLHNAIQIRKAGEMDHGTNL